MEWMEIISALALGMFIVVMFPAARSMVQNSPKGSSSDWVSFVIPVVMIMLFVMLLIELV
jgi:hypothetical protein